MVARILGSAQETEKIVRQGWTVMMVGAGGLTRFIFRFLREPFSNGTALNGTRLARGKCPPCCRRGRPGGPRPSPPAFLSRLRGRPPVLPRALALDSPAFVRSRINSRSNSASAPNRWNPTLPPGVVVSICSRRLRKPWCVFAKWPTVSIRWPSERLSRSSGHTTSVSPLRRWSRASAKPGRAVLDPLATSVKTRSHPAARRSSSWESRVWSVVETRA